MKKIIISTIIIVILALVIGGGYLSMHPKQQSVPVTPTRLTVDNDALTASLQYPVIPGEGEAIRAANASIKNAIDIRIQDFQKEANESAALGVGLPDTVKSTINGSPSIEEKNERYVSIFMGAEWYLRGAAHPSHTIDTYIYDYRENKLVTTQDLFILGSDYLPLLSRLSREDLIQQSKEGDLGFTYEEDMLEEGTMPRIENFSHILPTKDGLVVYFDEYQVAPYAAGPQQVVIPYAELKAIIDPSGVLGINLK
jgi:hypothetical protein